MEQATNVRKSFRIVNAEKSIRIVVSELSGVYFVFMNWLNLRQTPLRVTAQAGPYRVLRLVGKSFFEKKHKLDC